ncbi:hypothetical protein ACIOJ9_38825 [Streptomyces sp. NPDC088175]
MTFFSACASIRRAVEISSSTRVPECAITAMALRAAVTGDA